jgi:hypothetical protein
MKPNPMWGNLGIPGSSLCTPYLKQTTDKEEANGTRHRNAVP